MFIKPMNGQTVMLPDGGVLPIEGQEVTATQYWLRRLHDGDICEVQALEALPPHSPVSLAEKKTIKPKTKEIQP
ncbi:MAG: DUF2635 domain-containing protein [Ottowia sp.]|jgi:hypothetical protein|nr:DUF2635 domain-containing protein [Ottowia sp.]